eukprot:3322308-Ditylum_brightwellii.AAC.2
MDLWEKGYCKALVEDIIKVNRRHQPTRQRNKLAGHICWIYTQMLLQGKLRQAVRWVTGRDKGGLLLPSDTNLNTGLTVGEVLLSKHPDPTPPPKSAFKTYEDLPALINLAITAVTVMHIASRMQGSAGPGGVEAVSWQDWLLRFGAASLKLQEAGAKLTRWLANTRPAWAVYWALMAGRLIALDKCPDRTPHRHVASNNCAPALKQLWLEHGEEENWGILLVNAKNAFNQINCRVMLWEARHLWAAGSQFAFSTYCHWRKLVLRGQKGLILSKEGVRQGDPLSMILYALAVLPVILILDKLLATLLFSKKQLQEWFADDAALAGFYAPIDH